MISITQKGILSALMLCALVSQSTVVAMVSPADGSSQSSVSLKTKLVLATVAAATFRFYMKDPCKDKPNTWQEACNTLRFDNLKKSFFCKEDAKQTLLTLLRFVDNCIIGRMGESPSIKANNKGKIIVGAGALQWGLGGWLHRYRGAICSAASMTLAAHLMMEDGTNKGMEMLDTKLASALLLFGLGHYI